jgi:outer membrane lipoprotein LolB
MRVWCVALLMSALLTACATSSQKTKPLYAEPVNYPEWQGRISVQVLGNAPSSMSASFLLRGDAEKGELDLYSPLGTTIGALQWTPQLVQLSDGGSHQYFNSLADLTEKATGTSLPVEAIFGWLQGQQISADGWMVDLSNASQGSIFARRTYPAPEVMLRIKLDR